MFAIGGPSSEFDHLGSRAEANSTNRGVPTASAVIIDDHLRIARPRVVDSEARVGQDGARPAISMVSPSLRSMK